VKVRTLAAGVVLVGAGAVLWWARGPAWTRETKEAPGSSVAAAEGERRGRSPARPAAPSLDQGAAPAPSDAVQAGELLAQLVALLARAAQLSDEEKTTISDLEARILALGEAAAPALVERLDRGGDAPAARERLFNVLRQLPGPAVEARLVSEARSGTRDSLRTMAIESLAQRKTPQALDTLAAVAETDPNLPARPLIAQPRSPDDTGTEVPDEQVFTPRMQAMAALASTEDPRAAEVLAGVVRAGPDESLRMEAARNLKTLRGDARAAEALRQAASGDPSAYVRLAALHALQGSPDPALPALLQQIAANDRDAGVRILAKQFGDALAK